MLSGSTCACPIRREPIRYAAARDRVAMLAILDLRVEATVASYAMPHLSETFWVDQRPADPMIANARPRCSRARPALG